MVTNNCVRRKLHRYIAKLSIVSLLIIFTLQKSVRIAVEKREGLVTTRTKNETVFDSEVNTITDEYPDPSSVPSLVPSSGPSSQPSSVPSLTPSSQPSSVPSQVPSLSPSLRPLSVPSLVPSSIPSRGERDEHPSKEKILDHDTKIMMVVMGPKEKFPDWVKILSAINNITLSFIYGSFDEAISTDECDSHKLHADRNFDCSTLYIPNTTWTEGRNMLAGEVLKREKCDDDEDAKKGEVYDWWVFADDDLVPSCAEATYSMEALFGKGGEGESCWQKVFNFIKNDQNNIPEKVTTLSMPSWKIPARKGYIGASQVDALFAAFKRTYVPYLLPYATLEDGVSQWLSQSANFCIMDTCLKQTALDIPFIAGSNNAHREYPHAGFTAENFHQTMSNNFYNDTGSFYPCQEYWPKKQYADMTVVYNTKEELNEGIPDHKLSECDSLTHRFGAWKEEVMKDIL